MKYVFAFIVLATSATVFANTPDNERDNSKEFKFECSLETLAFGKTPAVSCEVKGQVCFGVKAENERRECEESRLAVRCNDGFRIWDDEARVDHHRGDITVIGKKHGARAVLLIEDIDQHRRDGRYDRGHERGHSFDAELLVSDGTTFRATGACEVEFFRNRR